MTGQKKAKIILMMVARHKTLVRHIMFWCVFILYEVITAFVLGMRVRWYEYVFYYTLNICLFYVTEALFSLSKGKNFQSIIIVFFSVVTALVLYSSFVIAGTGLIQYGLKYQQWNYTTQTLVRTIYRGVFFIGLSWGYYQSIKAVLNERKAAEASIIQLKTEQKINELYISQLQAQLNPHLLLNALQLLLAELTPAQANAKQIVKYLSQVFTYAAGRTDENGELPLSLELEQVENYISLQQYLYSFGLHVQVDIQTDDSVKDCRVSPLLLMTFVENFFKYGDLNKVDEPGTITINCKDGLLELETFNKKRTLPVYSGKLGLHNIKAILQTKYSDNKPLLKITDADGYYQVNLSIQL